MSYFNKIFGLYSDDKEKFLYFFGRKIALVDKKSYEKMSEKELLIELNKKVDSLINFENDINRIKTCYLFAQKKICAIV